MYPNLQEMVVHGMVNEHDVSGREIQSATKAGPIINNPAARVREKYAFRPVISYSCFFIRVLDLGNDAEFEYRMKK